MIAGHVWGGVIVYAALDAFGKVDKNPIVKRTPFANLFQISHATKASHQVMVHAILPNPMASRSVFLYETKSLYHLVAYNYETPMKSSCLCR